VGGKEKVLHSAGGTTELVEPGNLATRFGMGSDGDYGWCLQTVVAQFGALFRANFGHGGNLVIKGLECVGQTGARLAGENMKTPGLSETVGRRPMSVFEDFDKKFVSNFAAGIHESRLDGASRSIGKISRHGTYPFLHLASPFFQSVNCTGQADRGRIQPSSTHELLQNLSAGANLLVRDHI
jgi:hypothetical protein